MAKKQAAPPTTAEHAAMASALGLDLSKIDWAKWIQLLQLILTVLAQTPAPAQLKAAGATPKTGCEDHCCNCMVAAGLALESARTSLECCQEMCETGG